MNRKGFWDGSSLIDVLTLGLIVVSAVLLAIVL
jgi:hypothetical protein